MLKITLSFLIVLGLVAAPQAVKEAVEKTAKKTAKVTETVAKETVEGTKKVAKKTAKVMEPAVDKTVDATKAVGKKTAKVATETGEATKSGANKMADAVTEPKKKTTEKKAMSMSGKVNLNSATRAELIALPGIGEANADKIIAARPIASVEDLSSKKIIQGQYYEKVKGLVSVK